jgi:hypothetical protein
VSRLYFFFIWELEDLYIQSRQKKIIHLFRLGPLAMEPKVRKEPRKVVKLKKDLSAMKEPEEVGGYFFYFLFLWEIHFLLI